VTTLSKHYHIKTWFSQSRSSLCCLVTASTVGVTLLPGSRPRRVAVSSHPPPTLLTAVSGLFRKHSWPWLYNLGTDRTEKAASNSYCLSGSTVLALRKHASTLNMPQLSHNPSKLVLIIERFASSGHEVCAHLMTSVTSCHVISVISSLSFSPVCYVTESRDWAAQSPPLFFFRGGVLAETCSLLISEVLWDCHRTPSELERASADVMCWVYIAIMCFLLVSVFACSVERKR
jgi:hypothetical protein